MTILEELMDLALKVCENGREAGQRHHARGAALLAPNGKVYSGCDVYLAGDEVNGVSAERAAILAAVADGASKFEVRYNFLDIRLLRYSSLGYCDCIRHHGDLPHSGW